MRKEPTSLDPIKWATYVVRVKVGGRAGGVGGAQVGERVNLLLLGDDVGIELDNVGAQDQERVQQLHARRLSVERGLVGVGEGRKRLVVRRRQRLLDLRDLPIAPLSRR